MRPFRNSSVVGDIDGREPARVSALRRPVARDRPARRPRRDDQSRADFRLYFLRRSHFRKPMCQNKPILHDRGEVRVLVDRLRSYLPLPAQGRPSLMSALSRRRGLEQKRSRCRVIGIFDAGEEQGVLCQIEFTTDTKMSIVVAPIDQVSFLSSDIGAKQLAGQIKRRMTMWQKRRWITASNLCAAPDVVRN
jgi:hypothetical protein